jgi:hypothetical protein
MDFEYDAMMLQEKLQQSETANANLQFSVTTLRQQLEQLQNQVQSVLVVSFEFFSAYFRIYYQFEHRLIM